MRYTAKRFLAGILLLFLVSVLTFLLAELAPGDFLSEMRLNPQISAETVEALRTSYGLDQPLPLRYLRWLRSIAKGEFGFSFAHNRPVGALLWVRARNTLLLTTTATALAWLIAIPLGVWIASRQGGWTDRLSLGGISVLQATPELLLGLGCLLLAARSGLFPTGGMVSLGFAELGFAAKLRDLAVHLALPAAALVLGSLPILLRHVRSALVEVLDAPFVRVARGHGIPRRRLLFRYALPAAVNPLISLLGFSIATLVSGSLLIEIIMSWPGLGPLLLEAILARDLHVVIGCILLSGFFLVAGNLLADVLLYLADPRIQTSGTPR